MLRINHFIAQIEHNLDIVKFYNFISEKTFCYSNIFLTFYK